jgi:tetratricopeptide (TPR) repeat protein
MLREKHWNILSRWAGYAAIGLLLGIISFMGNLEIKDLDLWLHIGAGRFITNNGYIPLFDIFSNSIAGQPWDNHEWLFQVLVYRLYDAFGPGGLQQMQSVVVTVALGTLLFIGYHRERQLVVLVTLIMVAMVFQQRFTMRPDLFSLLFFTLYIFILSLHIDKRWAPWALALVQLAWVNIHGFFFFGPLFILLGIISEALKRHAPLPWEWNSTGRLDDQEYRNLGKAFVFVVLACLVNPGFWKGAVYPLGIFWNLSGEHGIFFKHIQELQAPLSWASLWDNDRFAAYKILILVSAVTFVLNRRAVDISALLLWLVFLAFSLKAVRNISFFAAASYLAIINNLFNLDPDRLLPFRFSDARFRHLSSLAGKIGVILWMLHYADKVFTYGYYDFDRYERKSEYGGVAQRSFPDKAVDFLVDNKISGNFFNDFNSGAYLIGRAYPRIRVFIDGRTEAYGADFFKSYMKIWPGGDGEAFDRAADKFQLTGALLNTSTAPAPKGLARHLYESPEWKPVYFDYDGLVFLKDVPRNREWIEEFEIDLAGRPAGELDLYRLGSMPVEPYRNYFRALTLESVGLEDEARAEALAALEVDAGYAGPYEILGRIESENKNFEQAYRYFRKAVVFSGGKNSARKGMARALVDLGQYKFAIEQYQKILRAWPDDSGAVYALARARAGAGEFELAREVWNRAAEKSPPDKDAAGEMLEVFINQGLWDEARLFLEDNVKDQFMDEPEFLDKKLAVYQGLNLFQEAGDLQETINRLRSGVEESKENKKAVEAR